ncbi:hypothetical protein GW17_00017344 [Ensete ventricosum]|nr:hypothetical protein GW17_00017344 [Ensete ventricosum]
MQKVPTAFCSAGFPTPSTPLRNLKRNHKKAQDAIFYSYTKYINGFAADLEEEEAMEMSSAWPESESFKDEGMGPIPPKWKGICQNDTDKGVRCNRSDHYVIIIDLTADADALRRKLIGLRYFNKGYGSAVGAVGLAAETPRDTDGHGTHTLSTAAGRFVPGANVFGLGNGTAKGGAPNARVAAYKVCWPPVNGSECFDADILAAFDEAIHDGVHVLSVSLGGGPTDYFKDGVAIGSFHAVKHGITVVCSAGNSGPESGTVSNTAPWIVTVGANTMDRDKLCLKRSLDPEKVRGKIVVCLRGENARVEKGEVVHQAGGIGMVLANDESTGNEIIADAHVLPATHISYDDGLAILLHLNSSNYGSGHVQPNRAMDPGLVYDLTTNDYLNFLCALGYNSTQIATFSTEPYVCPSKPLKIEDLNYPSITIPNLSGASTITRMIKNVGLPSTYKVHVEEPAGVSVTVKPRKLKFKKLGEEKKFTVALKDKRSNLAREYTFGGLTWSDGKHYVRSPIVVKVAH